jgi:hypothetical protein
MNLTGYDGFWFSDLGLEGDLEVGTADDWQINQSIVPRGAGTPLFGTSQPTPRTIDVTFTYNGAVSDLWEQFATLLGRLRPGDQGDTRKLYATRPNGVTVWRYARIALPHGWPQDDSVNTAVVQFISEDARWFKTTSKTVAPFDPAWTHGGHIRPGKNTGAIALPNSGWADVQPVISLGATVQELDATGSTLGWQSRRDFTITNNLTRPIRNYVAMLNYGDTATLVTSGAGSGGALASGNDFRIIGPNGLEVPRNLVAWNTVLTFIYFYIAQIEPGETQQYRVIYSNPNAGAPQTLTYPYQPAFLSTWVWGAVSSAVDAAKLFIDIGGAGPFAGDIQSMFAPGTGGRDNKYKDGVLYFQNGANAGIGKKIASHVWNSGPLTTRITFTSAFPNALNIADDWVILSSRNGVWMYDAESDEERGTDLARGRWYASSGESPPDFIDYTVPGAHQPYLYKDGRDKKGQPRYIRAPTIPPSGDIDTYTVLDAQRSWEQGARVDEEGVADGVSFSTPFPITGLDWAGEVTNPTGFAKAFIGQRSAGGNDWLELASDSGIHSTATVWTPTTTIVGSPTQLLWALTPALGDEVDQTWRRSAGSSTAVGTTTTLVDSQQSWQTNQWVGAKLRMTGGRRSGTVVTVTANTATVLTFTPAFGGNVKIDQPYEVINPPVLARMRDGDRLTITYDDSGLVIGALSSGAGGFPAAVDESTRIWIGGGKDTSAVIAGQRRSAIEIGKSGDYFVLYKTNGEQIKLDASRRSSGLYDSATGGVLERYVDPRVRWRYTDEAGNNIASGTGLTIPPGVGVLVNPGAESGITNWTKANSGTITSAITRDTTYYAKQEGGIASFKLAISASTGPAYSEMVADDRIPIQPGDLAVFAAWVFTENVNIKPLLGIRFYTAALATISTDLQSSGATYTNNIWYGEGHAAVAPATAAFWAPVIRGNIASGSPTGGVFFDDVNAGAPVLFYQADHFYTTAFQVDYTEAYFL